ncbi:MAG: DUF4838 domain-containing protein [Kiritimatiellae bacterium]|nr:DUF4838 domain-containing protein [Kiritimatiellia bacterium]
MKIKTSILFGLLLQSAILHSKELDLSRCTIILEDDASASQQYAAKEFSSYIYKITGREISVAPTAITNETKLLITTSPSEDNLGDEGFSISVKDSSVIVKGSRKRGSLYGIYELLERFGGVRWYSSTFEKVPRKKNFLVPSDFKTIQKPDFVWRAPFWYDPAINPEFAVRLRMFGPGFDKLNPRYGAEESCFGGGLGICHTFDKLCSSEKYFDEHPEYFSFTGGKRLKKNTQLCLTNPEVLSIVTSNVLSRIRKNPKAKFYGISQNDYYNFCECEDCAKIDNEEGSHSGTLIRFVNAVAEKVAEEFPDVFIETLAYQYTRKPPLKTKPAPNVVPCLCSYECDFAHSISNGCYIENIKFSRDLAQWSKISHQLMIWDYSTNFRHYPQIFPDVYALASNIKFYRDNSAKMIFFNGSYQGIGAYFEELKAYLQAKLSWDADLNVNELMDDFFDGFYGKAGKLIREDFEQAYSYYKERPFSCLSINDPLELAALPDSYFKRSLARQRKALKIAEKDLRHAQNVRKWALNVAYTCFFRLAMKMPEVALTQEDKTLRVELAKELYEYSKTITGIRWVENATLNDKRFLLIKKYASVCESKE